MSTYEEWRAIPGYEGLYEVSSLGQVRSMTRTVPARNRFGSMLKRYEGRVKATHLDKDGYVYLGLYRGGTGQMHRVSRLVLLAFVGQPEPGMEACHDDHDKTNNALSNLSWGTRLENEQAKTAAGRRPANTRRMPCPA